MPDITLLAVFLPTFFFVSITPGMCMTLAMTLGMSIGFRRTLWMMLGELVGVALVAIAAVMGVASVMLNYPDVFSILKWLGGIYLVYIGVNMWRSKGKMAIIEGQQTPNVSNIELVSQGFLTAIANPKGWAFMVSLLPPFINVEREVAPQLMALVSIILFTELISMMAYAAGGKSLRIFLSRGDNIKWMNRIAGSLMIFVGVWLALS
ncbi:MULTISPECIES: LysE family translocator [Shewanella]|uniref:LysE family translocator n=1 Tax=Shewanella fidelis TaxID=173509 RepID=A0AAW8NMV5_9GAMM|nr:MULTISPECIES: LysE family translocator [Shewanella]MDR8523620.1 LysE family translocator [Shewanella fidelis]MDW4810167.1 LysE family translocator [Shewanella fidelis]MDW4814312.1 LysE family translocator [Shewanella fidelis]MDW4818403.1 LysE family translocator [Shewanella fidelis]MDW4823945.1 LysE family translocator [Shewanella fidelis]